MARCTFVLLMLVFFLGSRYAWTAENNPGAKIPAKGVNSRTVETVNNYSRIRGQKSGDSENLAGSYAVPNRKKKARAAKEKKSGKPNTQEFVFQNFDDLPGLEKIKVRMLYEINRSKERLYNKFFNYSQYALDKVNNGRENEILDKAILGVIFALIIFVTQVLTHAVQVWCRKYSWFFHILRTARRN